MRPQNAGRPVRCRRKDRIVRTGSCGTRGAHADGAPEAMAGLGRIIAKTWKQMLLRRGAREFDFHTEAAKRENAELREAHVVLRRAAEDARSRLADAESRLRRSENTSVEDKNAAHQGQANCRRRKGRRTR